MLNIDGSRFAMFGRIPIRTNMVIAGSPKPISDISKPAYIISGRSSVTLRNTTKTSVAAPAASTAWVSLIVGVRCLTFAYNVGVGGLCLTVSKTLWVRS